MLINKDRRLEAKGRRRLSAGGLQKIFEIERNKREGSFVYT